MRQTVFETHKPEGQGEPLLLLHGGSSSWSPAWRRVIPLLTEDFQVFAPDLAGHACGPALPVSDRTTIEMFADAAEQQLDDFGLQTAHLAGNSLGGWAAMELARRGRARSVVAFSPAGGWEDRRSADRLRRYVRRTVPQARAARPIAPWLMRLPVARWSAMRPHAAHPRRISPELVVEALDALLAADLARVPALFDDFVQPYDDPRVPVLIAWSAKDRFIPMPHYSDPWKAAAPFATWTVLPGVGHVPMLDDPRLVADTISDWAGRS